MPARPSTNKKPFDNEWILEPLAGRATFFTKRMFGGLAAYVHDRQMLVLVEPTKTGRWTWHGVLVCTDYAHHTSICAEFPGLKPHDVLQKWLYIDSTHRNHPYASLPLSSLSDAHRHCRDGSWRVRAMPLLRPTSCASCA